MAALGTSTSVPALRARNVDRACGLGVHPNVSALVGLVSLRPSPAVPGTFFGWSGSSFLQELLDQGVFTSESVDGLEGVSNP